MTQKNLLEIIVDNDAQKAIKLWNLINHEKKSQLIEQLDHDILISMFTRSKLEDQIDLILLMSQEYREILLSKLSLEQR